MMPPCFTWSIMITTFSWFLTTLRKYPNIINSPTKNIEFNNKFYFIVFYRSWNLRMVNLKDSVLSASNPLKKPWLLVMSSTVNNYFNFLFLKQFPILKKNLLFSNFFDLNSNVLEIKPGSRIRDMEADMVDIFDLHGGC